MSYNPGSEYKTITIPPGAFEISQISSEIAYLMYLSQIQNDSTTNEMFRGISILYTVLIKLLKRIFYTLIVTSTFHFEYLISTNMQPPLQNAVVGT